MVFASVDCYKLTFKIEAMATEEERILDIKVDVDESIKKIVEYRKALEGVKMEEAELKKQKKEGTISEQKYREGIEQTRIKTQQYNEAIRVLTKEVNNNIKSDKGKSDSLKGLRAELSNITAKYDNLSKAERENAEVGGKLEKQINEITKEIKDAEEATGRYYRNVGNYENAIKNATMSSLPFGNVLITISENANGARGVFNETKTALLGLTKQAIAFMATGLGFFLTAIAAAVALVSKGIATSEEQSNRWRVAIAPLKVVLDGFSNALTWLSDKLISVVEWGGKWTSIIMKAAEAIPLLGDEIKKLNEAQQKRVSLSKQQIAYEQAVRAEIVASAEREREISELRSKAAEKDKYTAKERLKFLDDAIAKETEQATKKKELAQMHLDALKLEGSLTENDAEMNNKLAEAEAAVIRADTELNDKTRELKAQRVEAINAIKAETKALEENKAVKDGINKVEEKVQESSGMTDEEFKKEYDRQRKLAEARLAAVESSSQEELDLKKKLNELMLNEELRQYEEDEEMKAAIREKYRVANLNLDKAYNDEKVKQDEERAQKEIEIEEAKLQAMRTVTGSLTDLMDAIGESSKAAAIASKVVALAQIAIDTGTAISKAVTTSSAKGFWGFLAEVGPFIAAIVSNMAQAIKTVKGAKFATGGDVSGPGTGTSDSIPAMLSNGESVLTARATSMFAPILSAFNQAGGGVPIQGQQTGNQAMGEDMLARAFAKGLSLLPSPVVSVEEITTVSNRVKAIENISRI